MNFSALERRRDPRTPAYVPITLQYHDADTPTPGHLMDLSTGGAGIATTVQNAPALGQFVDLQFQTPNTDGGSETRMRRETGIVVNISKPERGIARVGVRFLQYPDLGSQPFDPKTILSWHRKQTGPFLDLGTRWQTARNFDKSDLVGSHN